MTMLSNLNDIAVALRGIRTPVGIKFRCPCHEDSSPSCSAWYGERAIMVKCFAGCESIDIIAALQNMGFTTSSPHAIKPHIAAGESATKNRDFAIKLWLQSKPIKGSIAEKYLIEIRRLDISGIDDIDGTLRFHPSCPRGRDERVPTLLAGFRRNSPNNQLTAVQRIFLTPDGRKDGKPMMLGPVTGSAIMLTSQRQTFINGKCKVLHICEGVETGIGAMMCGFNPQWVVGSTSGIRQFEPHPQISELCICADPDPAGREAAFACIDSWSYAGAKAYAVIPA